MLIICHSGLVRCGNGRVLWTVGSLQSSPIEQVYKGCISVTYSSSPILISWCILFFSLETADTPWSYRCLVLKQSWHKPQYSLPHRAIRNVFPLVVIQHATSRFTAGPTWRYLIEYPSKWLKYNDFFILGSVLLFVPIPCPT